MTSLLLIELSVPAIAARAGSSSRSVPQPPETIRIRSKPPSGGQGCSSLGVQ